MAQLTRFCLSSQGGHMLTPLPAATPMKPGSAVSTSVLLPRGREGSPEAAARRCSSSWHCLYHGLVVTSLPGRSWDGAACGEVAATQNPRPGPVQLRSQAPCATASPKLPLLCLPLPLVHGVLMRGLTSMSPCSLVPMADVPLLRCGPCHLERVGGRAGRRSRRLPGKDLPHPPLVRSL